MTDINFGISPTPIEPSRSIYVTSEKLSIKHHNFENVLLQDFLSKMIEAPLARKNVVLAGEQDDINKKKMMRRSVKSNDDNHYHANSSNNNSVMHFSTVKNQKITVKRLFEHLNFSITDNAIVIADVGDSLFGALDLTIHGQTDFLSPAYYCSMGFAVPAAIGAQLANPTLRPIVIVGDGAFQMTGMETLSMGSILPVSLQTSSMFVA